MKTVSKILTCILALIIVLSVGAVGAAAVVDTYGANETVDKSVLPGNRVSAPAYSPDIKSCANMGNWQKYAENALEAVSDCTTDYVSVDVKLTKDGIPILMKDETLDRMCVDSQGETVTGAVKDKTYQEISGYFLRYGNGGELSKKSNYTVPTLEAVLNVLKDGTNLIIDTKLDDLGTVYNVALNAEMLGRVMFRLEDCDSKDVLSVINKNQNFKNLIIPQYNGNIIFGANNLLKDAAEAELNIVKVGTKNHHGVVLYNSYTSQFQENYIMAMFSMVDEYAAGRNDDVTGWDNVISNGYSIIETDYPDMLEQYIEDTEDMRSDLKSLVEVCADYLNGSFSASSLNALTDAYETAYNCLNSVSSRSEISNAFYTLSEAYSALEPSAEDETIGKFTFSAGRVIAVVLCAGAVVASQVYLFKKRKK